MPAALKQYGGCNALTRVTPRDGLVLASPVLWPPAWLKPSEAPTTEIARTNEETRETPSSPDPTPAATIPADDHRWREALRFWSEDHLERWGELAGAIEADQGVTRREAEGQAFLALVCQPQRFAPGERDPFGPCPAQSLPLATVEKKSVPAPAMVPDKDATKATKATKGAPPLVDDPEPQEVVVVEPGEWVVETPAPSFDPTCKAFRFLYSWLKRGVAPIRVVVEQAAACGIDEADIRRLVVPPLFHEEVWKGEPHWFLIEEF